MASASSMEPSSARATSSVSDPCPPPSPTPSSDGTSNPGTPVPSCSFAPPASPSISPPKPSARKRSPIECLDEEIQKLLLHKLVYEILHGRPSDTLQFHRRQLAMEMTSWIKADLPKDTYNFHYRDQLLSLLASGARQMPMDEAEWTRLLNQWIRSQNSDNVVHPRHVYQILAVDGFRGFRPKDLKVYLPGILFPVRVEYRVHAQGVRAMYEFFDDHPAIESLTGTDSACVVFLSLLHLYVSRLELFDDQLSLQIEQARAWAEGFLHRHSDYYRDLKNVDEEVIMALGNVYLQQFGDAEDWKVVGKNLLRDLKVPPPNEKAEAKERSESSSKTN